MLAKRWFSKNTLLVVFTSFIHNQKPKNSILLYSNKFIENNASSIYYILLKKNNIVMIVTYFMKIYFEWHSWQWKKHWWHFKLSHYSLIYRKQWKYFHKMTIFLKIMLYWKSCKLKYKAMQILKDQKNRRHEDRILNGQIK